MKRSSFAVGWFIVFTLVTLVCSSRSVVAQAAKPTTPKPAATPAVKLTAAQSASLKLAWDNLYRGYEDLKSTPPDVKGDTARLEGHMTAAMNLLHQVDPAHIQAAPTNIAVMDKGRTRAFILSAARGHLDKARSVIESAKVNHPNIAQVMDHIGAAERELGAAGAAAPTK